VLLLTFSPFGKVNGQCYLINNLSANSNSPDPYEICPEQICTLEVLIPCVVATTFTYNTVKWYQKYSLSHTNYVTLQQSGGSTQFIIDNNSTQSKIINTSYIPALNSRNNFKYYYELYVGLT